MDYSNYYINSDEITLYRRNIFTMGQKTLSSAISLVVNKVIEIGGIVCFV